MAATVKRCVTGCSLYEMLLLLLLTVLTDADGHRMKGKLTTRGAAYCHTIYERCRPSMIET